MKLPGWVQRATGRDGFWWVASIIFVLVVGGLLSLLFWDELGSDTESLSTTIRNVALVIGGIIAMILAMWRSLVAQRQADAALRQATTALVQARTAEQQSTTALRSFLNERYELGSSKLESDDPITRIEGIDVLERLAREHPADYHVQILKRLCMYVRTSANSDRGNEEIRAAMTAIGSRNREDIELEAMDSYELNLGGSVLRKAYLPNINLSGANLIHADLSGAWLRAADLSNARLFGATLKDTDLTGTNLSGAQFSIGEGNYPASGITQIQLDVAASEKDNLPKLDGMLDAESGKKLIPPRNEPGWMDALRALVSQTKQGQADSPQDGP